MAQRSRFHRFTMSIWLISAGVLLSGTKACQEDYDLGSRTSGRETATPSPTPTDEGDLIDEETPTPTPSPTVASSPTPTGSVTPTPSAGLAFLGALAAVAQSYANDSKDDPAPSVKPSSDSERASLGGNWLGQSYVKEERSELTDRDADGYSDDLEVAVGTDSGDEYSQPSPGASVLSNRFRGLDDDYDGLSNLDEEGLGTNPNRADTDGDGVRDGAEFASESDPTDPGALPVDRDGDGLSDTYEEEIGSDPRAADSDKDKLLDSIEVAIGGNPLNPDTDGDGIFDGREYQAGSDLLVKDF